MVADLEGEDLDVRSMTVSNLMFHAPGIGTALPLLGKAMSDPSERISSRACHALSKLGRELSPEEVGRCEELSRATPADPSLHILLLGSYALTRFRSGVARTARQVHVLALIKDSPTSPVFSSAFAELEPMREGEAYREAKLLWLKHVQEQPKNTTILGNAAGFFTIHDRTLSGELLRRAKALEPENPIWSERLGHLYSLESIGCPPEAKRDWAAMALAELESAAARTTHQRKLTRLLVDLASAAFEAGELAKARSFSERLLSTAMADEDGSYDADALHHGHIILGRLALKDGDRDAAKAHLLGSVGPKGSPVLSSFGPKMNLAKELLERGEKATVLQYLRLCSAFWAMGAEQLKDWTATVERGQTPDFGTHLSD